MSVELFSFQGYQTALELSVCFFVMHFVVFDLLILLVVISYAFGILRRFVPEEKVDGVQGLSLTADGTGAVFDVPANDLDAFLAGKILPNC